MLSEGMGWRASCTEQTVFWQKNITRLQNLLHFKCQEMQFFSPCTLSKRELGGLSGKDLAPAVSEECEYLDYKGIRTEPHALSIFIAVHHRL